MRLLGNRRICICSYPDLTMNAYLQEISKYTQVEVSVLCVGIQLVLRTSSSVSPATVSQHDFTVTATTSVAIGQMNTTAVSISVISSTY